MGKWLIDAHVHPVGGCISTIANLGDKIKARKDTFRLNTRHPEIFRARLTEKPFDISDEYVAAMDRHDISHAIIQQDYGTTPELASLRKDWKNDMVADVVKKHPGRLFGLICFHGWEMHPIDRTPGNMPTEKELASYRSKAAEEVARGVEELGLIGVGEFWPGRFTQETHPAKIARDMKPFMDVVAKYKIPILFHTAWTQFPHDLFYGDPIWTDEIAYGYPEVPVVLCKMGRSTHFFDNALMVALRICSAVVSTMSKYTFTLRKA
ncbi:amidohydrolase family protein, partial [Chloroflexota bacterium]